jgi:putative spermidine/putrescine transport system permease protein
VARQSFLANGSESIQIIPNNLEVGAMPDKSNPITTADGTPLKTSLRRAERKKRIKGFLFLVPPLVFITITFIFPIASMLLRSVYIAEVKDLLHHTVASLENWDGQGVPGESTFYSMAQEVLLLKANRSLGKVALRLNYEKSGMRSLLNKTARKVKRVEGDTYKEKLLSIDKRWGDREYWAVIKRLGKGVTAVHVLASFDLKLDADNKIVSQPEELSIHSTIWLRTLWVSLSLTGLCILLGYPVAYLLATLPLKTSNLLMICILLPFWTSILVRLTSWIVLLQKEGVLNDILVWIGIISDENRIRMVYNMTGTFVAMLQVLLPFMILPLYSVMKTIDPSYMRAARSLGANPAKAFWEIYVPQTLPGIGAGGILVFILAVGYYITPALVGGATGQLISNFIALHMSKTLNWGLAAAMGTILLMVILAIYWLYNRLIGIENMKLG